MRNLLPTWFAFALLLTPPAAAAQTALIPAGGASDVASLQKRLTSAGCYSGPIDGVSSAPLDEAIRVCPPQEPQLRIETGMHSSTIWRISTDAACRIAVTGSDDKTVRLWSVPEGRLLRTQRLPIGPERLGQFNSVAISRDGTLAAAGGYDAFSTLNGKHSIYVFDVATGQNVRRFGVLDYAIQEIVFSPDGKLIAVGALAGGVHVIDITTGQDEVFDKGLAAPVEGLAFGPDGSLYAVSADGFVRHYTGNARPQKTATRSGRQPISVSVDPTGNRVAVGFNDKPAVEEFDAHTLRRLGAADTSDLRNGHLPAVAWSGDGQTLFAGGFTGEDVSGHPGERFIRRFNLDGTRNGGDVPVSTGSIMGLASCGDGVAFASSEPSFGLLHAQGDASILGRGHIADMRDKLGDAFQISRDGTQVRAGLGFDAIDPILFDLLAGEVREAGHAVPGLVSPDVTALPVDGWLNSNTVKFGGRLILPISAYRARSLAIRPDRAGFVLGTSDLVLSFDARGRERWRIPAYTEAWGVNLAQNGDLIVSTLGDGTIRWYRWSDGKELLALFVDTRSKRWVAWTPTGYYMASPGGEDLIGWHVNRGWNQTADFFPASRFRARFSRPDIVRLVLKTLDEDEAVKQANETARRKEDTKPLIAQLPPVIRIAAPANLSHITAGEVTIAFAWRSPSGLPVDQIAVLVNGHTVKIKGLAPHEPGKDMETEGSVAVALTDRMSEVGLIAQSGDLSSQVASVKIEWDGAPAASSQDRKLYAVIVGISDYADAAMSLGFAAKDARDFAKALGDQKGGYYGDVKTHLMTDRAVTRESIIEGLEWLEANVTRKNDTGVLFLAGHGVTDEKQAYWFLPSDATEDNFRFKGVSQDEMRRSLGALPGKIIWFLDTCHAGRAAKRHVDMNVLVNAVTAPENGSIITFASSTGSELSEERPDWQNGAFTKAIVEGIEDGKAARVGDGSIMTLGLEAFLEDRVQDLTGGKQHPVLGWPLGETNFAIAQNGKPHKN